jgi:hypothetical protein
MRPSPAGGGAKLRLTSPRPVCCSRPLWRQASKQGSCHLLGSAVAGIPRGWKAEATGSIHAMWTRCRAWPACHTTAGCSYRRSHASRRSLRRQQQTALTPTERVLQHALAGTACRGGAHPDEIDLVVCTHLHPDHCGWNTQLVDGRWTPTQDLTSLLAPRPNPLS